MKGAAHQGRYDARMGDGRTRDWGAEAQVRIYLAKGEVHQGRNDAGRSSRFFGIVFKK